jgi:hypothetical protein
VDTWLSDFGITVKQASDWKFAPEGENKTGD